MNRRTKGGPIDHDLPVLFVKDAKGKVRAVYLSYACHCVTLSHNKIGGDWAGFAASAIEEHFPDAVALVAIGCGADQNPNSGVTGDKVEVATAQGREIAAEVKRLSQNFLAPVNGRDHREGHDAGTAARGSCPRSAQWEEKAKRMDAIGHHARVTLAKLDKGEKLPTKIAYPVQTWAFGDSLAMVHLPGEVVVDYSLRLKKELDGRRLWVTAYANDAPCYIPSERVLKEGGYEGGGAMIYYDLPGRVRARPRREDRRRGEGADRQGVRGEVRPEEDRRRAAAVAAAVARAHQDEAGAARSISSPPSRWSPIPVAIAFGPDGKLWVAEMADYPSGKSGQVRARRARSCSSKTRTATATSTSPPSSSTTSPSPPACCRGARACSICAAPDILYAEDTDGDGKADKVEKLYTGFGTENYQARVNSLQYGLDGWVYGSCGLFGGKIKCHEDRQDGRARRPRLPHQAGHRRARARDRPHAAGPRPRRLGQLVRLRQQQPPPPLRPRRPLPAAQPARRVPERVGERRARRTELFPLKADAQRFELSGPPGTVTAACGLGIYRDDLLGEDFTGNAFTCEPVNLLVTAAS